ncbi:MAG: hypothetical protein RL518_1342 [Pseudomonadota bacterium]
MTQPYQPERPRSTDQNPWEEQLRRAAFGPSAREEFRKDAPEPQQAPLREDPFDKLAGRLLELGLYARREVFLEGTLWKIVANDLNRPEVEVRIAISFAGQTRRDGSIMTIEVRPQALLKDCERAWNTVERFIRSIGSR